MKRTNAFSILVFIAFMNPSVAYSTIVVPFRNLAEVANTSEAVVFGTCKSKTLINESDFSSETMVFETDSWLKSSGQKTILVKTLHQFGTNWEKVISGDLKPEIGKTYLLFLNANSDGSYKMLCLSYYTFQEFELEKIKYLVPSEESQEIHMIERPDGQVAEPLMVYQKDKLLTALYNCIQSSIPWNASQAGVSFSREEFIQKIGARVEPPGHCTYLFPVPWVRWTGFTGTNVKVWGRVGGDANCANALTYTSDAVTELESQYGGIQLAYQGTFSGYTPNCTGGAAGGNYTEWVNANLGGSRHMTVLYNDPCEEITDLVSCAGVIAQGGLYGFSDLHSYQGKQWRRGGYGFIIVNDNTGSCYCTNDYNIMLQHELTHCLGHNHIAPGAGSANMNPSCCNSIGSLDIQCLDYTYSPALPVELISFTGIQVNSEFKFNWKTASERDAESFTLESSQDGKFFSPIAMIKAFGNSVTTQTYSHSIPSSIGINYFRLLQTDLDKTSRYVGPMVVLESQIESILKLSVLIHNQSSLNFTIQNLKSEEARLSIYDNNGRLYFSKQLNASGFVNGTIDTRDWPAASYQATITDGSNTKTTQFIVRK